MNMDVKKNFYRGLGNRSLPVLFSVLLFASCQDDLQTSVHTGPGIRFSVSEDKEWHATRAAGSPAEATTPRDSLLGVLPLQAADGGEGLYLHAMIADGIEVTGANGQIDEPQTRGSLVEADNFYDSFGVLASVYTGTWSEDSCLPDYMYDVEVTEASAWTTSYYWPGASYKMKFFAYAPKDNGQYVLSGSTHPGSPSISVTIPSDVNDQEDLLVAQTAELAGNTNTAVALTFNHALTAVRFVCGDDMQGGTVKSVALKKVYSFGTFDYGTRSWSIVGTPTIFSQTLNKSTTGATGEALTTDAQTFMMIPQKLPEGAEIEVVYADKLTGMKRTLTASIAGTEWPMGKTITYRISTSSIVITPTFTVTAPADFTYAGGSENYSVTSYATVFRPGDATQTVPVAWIAEFVEDDGSGGYNVIARPEWLTAFTASGNGGTSATTFSAMAMAQQGVTSNAHNEVLQSAAPVSGTYDLSTKGGTTAMNTANCYAINAPGSYSLPLVYGNAIKEGNENFSAYLFSPQKFVNHLDMAIGNPYIYNNANCTPDDAVLVWQDEENLVTNVRLSPDKHNLIFDVPQATIKQGNAIVAVRDKDSRIMWSWHIWVTDFVPGLDPTVEERYDPVKTPRDKVVTNYQGAQYTFMGANIGWCDAGTTTYDDRSVKVRFTQAETGSTQVITLTQASHSVVNSGNQTYFQFGRKDPMLGAIREVNGSTVDKTFYPGSYSFDKSGTGKVTIGTSIQNPHVFFNYGSAKPQDWSATTYNNLWHISGPKTIYDPSPVGYQLPLQDAFKGFTYNGNYVSGNYFLSRFNSPYTSTTDYTDNFGWEFYCNKMTGEGSYDTAGGTIFFPALCYRHRENGSVNLLGDTGYYWAASPFSNDEGYSLFFTGTSIWPVNNGRTSGFAVRPVREK